MTPSSVILGRLRCHNIYVINSISPTKYLSPFRSLFPLRTSERHPRQCVGINQPWPKRAAELPHHSAQPLQRPLFPRITRHCPESTVIALHILNLVVNYAMMPPSLIEPMEFRAVCHWNQEQMNKETTHYCEDGNEKSDGCI